MNLKNFDKFFDQTILARGRDYFKNGRVLTVEEAGNNYYVADVEGTDIYSVDVLLDDEAEIKESVCDCPYDMGEYCKHQAAVFYALRDMLYGASGEIRAENGPAPAGKVPTRKKSKKGDLQQILSERTKDELIEIILNFATEKKEIKTRLEFQLDNGSIEDELQKSVKLIRSTIKANADRSGYVDYRNVSEAVAGAEFVLEKAQSAVKKDDCLLALELALCVIQEMTALLHDADDSDGIISSELYQCIEIIRAIPENLRVADIDKVFARLLKEVTSEKLAEFPDWTWDLLRTCAELTDTQPMRNKLDEHLNRIAKDNKDDSRSSLYEAEQVNLIRYKLVERFDGPGKAQDFLELHLEYPEFRKLAIEKAIREKAHETVIRLALDGERADAGNYGLLNRWRTYRYKTYKLCGMLGEQRKIAEELALCGSFEYYKELKSTYAPEDWSTVYTGVLSFFENANKNPYDIYLNILVEEKEQQKLMAYVKKQPYLVERFFVHLIPEFANEVYAVFQQNIEKSAAEASDRSGYRRVCNTLRMMKKAGGIQQAAEIKQRLSAKYIRKPAFLNELSKI